MSSDSSGPLKTRSARAEWSAQGLRRQASRMRSGVLCGPPSVHICRPCPLPVTHSLLQNLKVHPMFDTRCTLCSRLENPCPRPVHLLRFLSFSHAKKARLVQPNLLPPALGDLTFSSRLSKRNSGSSNRWVWVGCCTSLNEAAAP